MMAVARLALVTAIGVALAVLAGGVFDAWQWTLLLVPMVVAAAAFIGRLLPRIAELALLVAGVVASVVVAVMTAGGSFGDAVPGALSGPRRLLTTEWPSPSEPTLVGAIALLLAITTALAAWLAWQPRFHLAPLVPPVVCLVMLLALGAPVRPPVWLVAVMGALAAIFALTRQGERIGERGVMVLGDRTLALGAVALALTGIGTSTAVAWSDRADPRDTKDAELSASLIDPIEAMVALRSAAPPIEMFEVTDRSSLVGPSLPARWRLAALDVYDGQRWVPRITLRPIGARLGVPTPPEPDRPPAVRYDVTYLTDDLDLVPFPGRALLVDADVETDLDRVAVRLLDRPAPGTVVRAESEVAPTPGDARASGVVKRVVDELALGFADEAALLTDADATEIDRLRQLERTMRTEWELDSGAPGGGQQLALIDRFINETRRGTREQFVTAFVLLARSLGYDARVATGFVVPPSELASPLVVGSDDAAAWPEVLLDGLGWAAFDPVPASETSEADVAPPPPQAQSPAAAQPPIAPPVEDGEPTDEIVSADDESGSRFGSYRDWLVRVGAVGGLSVLPFVLTIGGVLVLKRRRRGRRLRTGDPTARVRGAWANTTDSLVDAGLEIGPAWTDDRIALQGAPIAPGVPFELRRLASMSTAVTFGAGRDADRLADDAVHTSKAVDAAIRGSRTRWERLRWRLSLRSLRRRSRSPVTT